MFCGGGDVPVDTEWLFKSFPRATFSSWDVTFAPILGIFVVEEEAIVDDAAKFSVIGDDASSAPEAEVVTVALEVSTRGLSSEAIASANYKFLYL